MRTQGKFKKRLSAAEAAFTGLPKAIFDEDEVEEVEAVPTAAKAVR